MSTILILDDEQEVHDKFTGRLPKYTFVHAFDSQTAWKLYEENKAQITLILMDGYLGLHDVSDTALPITRRIRADGFTKPMIAISGDERIRRYLVNNGCSHAVSKNYMIELVDLIERLLAQKPKRKNLKKR